MMKAQSLLLEERQGFIHQKGSCGSVSIQCDTESLSGAVSQRACVYCGARVVLNPITDAFHIVHGPIGCASYTWDIRGSLSSGAEWYRNSFSTDLSEQDVIFGGEKKLWEALSEVTRVHSPRVIFVYATCIVGVIGDDVRAVCKRAEEKFGIPVIPVMSPGFAGHKSVGYRMACNALMELLSRAPKAPKRGGSVNILGDFNLAGEMWIIKNYLEEMGVKVVARITGDATCEELMHAGEAALNVVQCAGSMTYLAKRMEEAMGIPWIKVSFFGIEDTSQSLIHIAQALGDREAEKKARELIARETRALEPVLCRSRELLGGKKAAIYVGGGFKAISLIKQFREIGMETVVVGTQTGRKEDYDIINSLVREGTVVLDDANPAELEYFIREKQADVLVGGVKERPLAYKLGVAFLDHNHERRHPLAGFVGVRNFVKELQLSVNSPVWQYVR
ncbi:nitrogenase iron-molybdenum cofactor biosynthesis protein NifE [Thermoclostridium caenicola]|nr:nitrogenase iron-molybdenum cofactor biosynthesis protein NifE [Thermoclostridium caenicola]HOP73124.1 nitrogenase iron-molybdenum cofactor biosynthesis protein NifE [Thermoclostridium caenicola]